MLISKCPLLGDAGGLALTIVRCGDEVAAILIGEVAHLKGSLLRTLAHGGLPVLAKVHRTQT